MLGAKISGYAAHEIAKIVSFAPSRPEEVTEHELGVMINLRKSTRVKPYTVKLNRLDAQRFGNVGFKVTTIAAQGLRIPFG